MFLKVSWYLNWCFCQIKMTCIIYLRSINCDKITLFKPVKIGCYYMIYYLRKKKGFSFTLHPKNIIVYTISILMFLLRFIEKFLCDFQKWSRILSVILKSTKWFTFDKVGLTNQNEVCNYFALVSIKSPFFCLTAFSYSSEFLEVSLLFTNNHIISYIFTQIELPCYWSLIYI